MRTRVSDPIDERPGEIYACAEIAAGSVVDRINPDRPVTNLRLQRVDEGLPDPANTGWLAGATGENHLDVGARVGRRRGNGRAKQRHPGCCRHGANETSDPPCFFLDDVHLYSNSSGRPKLRPPRLSNSAVAGYD